MKNWILLGFLCAYLGTSGLQAQEKKAPDEHPAHDELRALRDALFDAYQEKDIDRLLQNVHENVVVTWQNGVRHRGHAAIRTFRDQWLEERVERIGKVESERHELTVDELSILYGDDIAVAFGSVDDELELAGGKEFKLRTYWTATVVKEEDKWLLASLHLSANLFDNPILDVAKDWLYYVGTIAFVVGLVLAVTVPMIVTKVRKRNA